MPGGAWDYFVDPRQKIGYLKLTNFTKKSYDELKAALQQVQEEGARGVILDLRYNPGGLLTAATEISDKFLGDGTIVSTRADRENPAQPPVSIEAHPSADDCNLPLVVLVNQFSASASEIVSGALKDQHRAIIVGERTFGKGSVQMLFSLANRTAYLKLTTSHYYLPSGKCIHKEENSTTWGVEPDVSVEMTPKQMTDAVEARQDQEVLRDADAPVPAPSTNPSTKPKKDLLAADPQLSAALLVLRLQLAGASL
jgi:carboxyl-terminal processing protease